MLKEQYVHMVIAATIGIIIQLMIKANRLRAKARACNEPFSFLKWFKDDWIILTLNILSPYVVVYLFDEWAMSGDELEGKWARYIKTLFVFVGFSGSAVLMGFFSVADKKFNKVIDTKTNIADYGTPDKPNG